MLPRFFARRYLFSPRSRSVVNLISRLSVAAVAIPVAAMIILLSVFNGFESLVRSMYSAFDADLTLTPRRGQTFSPGDLDTVALSCLPGIAALSFTLEQSALLEHDGRQATATIRGVDDSYGRIFDLEDAVVTGEWRVRLGDLERLVIGQSMAWMLGIRSLADADVTLYAVRRGSFSTLLPMENYTRRTEPVGGVYVLDLDTERTYVLTSLRLAQALFGTPDRASALLLRTTPGADLNRTRRAVADAAGDAFEVRLVRRALELDLPLFTTCRGTQVMNVALGGSLCMNVAGLEPREGMALWRHQAVLHNPVHPVEVEEGSLLWSAVGGSALVQANSSHHCCVERLGEGVRL